MSEERLQEIIEELAKISFSNIGHCVNTNLILDYITNLQQEIERLNNIINDLEKYIIDFKEDYEKNEFQPNAKVYIYWKDLIDKLQELKGSDKE